MGVFYEVGAFLLFVVLVGAPYHFLERYVSSLLRANLGRASEEFVPVGDFGFV